MARGPAQDQLRRLQCRHPQRIRIMTATSTSQPSAQANAENRYEVTRADLPLSCPMPSMALWNSHPRVYLPIEEEGQCKCPYCGALYVLIP